MDEQFEIERRGAAAGINPMFGDWQQRFDLQPVSYANGGNARAAFKAAVRAQLTNKFVFVGEISLRVVLYLDEQKMLETPSYGDIDNHAKQLLDTIKGPGGLLIDDCQVQHIDISWIDVPHGVHFEMAIKASPDFMALPLRLYGDARRAVLPAVGSGLDDRGPEANFGGIDPFHGPRTSGYDQA